MNTHNTLRFNEPVYPAIVYPQQSMVTMITSLSEQDKDAIRTMIREEIAAATPALAREVMSELAMQSRLRGPIR